MYPAPTTPHQQSGLAKAVDLLPKDDFISRTALQSLMDSSVVCVAAKRKASIVIFEVQVSLTHANRNQHEGAVLIYRLLRFSHLRGTPSLGATVSLDRKKPSRPLKKQER